MYYYDALEQAYKNGYEQARKDYTRECELCYYKMTYEDVLNDDTEE